MEICDGEIYGPGEIYKCAEFHSYGVIKRIISVYTPPTDKLYGIDGYILKPTPKLKM